VDLDETLRVLGRTIARKREERGLTQEKLAARLTDKDERNYARIEQGKRNLELATLFEIAAALGVPIGELFEDLR